ncbi:MAG: A/G-specific adenine glycosylase [Clostridium sp.]|jgi:A/G-specific adenine glycosylase|nr:A/G-specific adenine glycosylase [Clostridium sp.]
MGAYVAQDIAGLPRPLLAWYEENRRILPWREEPDPYRVWVSEIMLQQTRVEAVKPYFERFMKRLPDIASLSGVEEEVLLKLWEGLGYYNRARNLRQAAIQVMERHGGRLPADYEQLLRLKGIGSYTAGAIASIAFHRPYPAVDGNVLRVLSRICMDEALISEGKTKAEAEAALLPVMPKERPGDFNQAMMELGACVCVPNGAPHCGGCPVSFLCKAHRAGKEMEFPKKAGKKQRLVEEKTVLVIRDADKAALRKRPKSGLLAGMYEFPSMSGFRTAEEVARYLGDNGFQALRIQPLAEAKHIFSHREWHMTGYLVRVDELEGRKPSGEQDNWIFLEPEETKEKYPIPAAFSAYTKYLDRKPGSRREE